MNQREKRIWAFDFDGTISNLVPIRDAAAIDPSCEDLLRDLACDPGQLVVVVSSRTLKDLQARISIASVVLCGSSGIEWRIPGGHWLSPDHQAAERLATQRTIILPALDGVARIPGVEIEDKTWSVAVHFRAVSPEDRLSVQRELENLKASHALTLHYGPDVAELQFFPEVSKRLAIQTLLRLFGPKYTSNSLFYAGDDQNDAEAMQWIAERQGIIYVVGNRIQVDGATRVDNPSSLARAVRDRFGIAVRHRFGMASDDSPEIGV